MDHLSLTWIKHVIKPIKFHLIILKNKKDKARAMERVNCNLCGSSSYKEIYNIPDVRFNPQEIFSVVECECCGLGFVNPRPDINEMKKFYPVDFYQSLLKSEEKDLSRLRSQANYINQYHINDVSKKKKLLDVGCANGSFLKFMREIDFEVYGVDPYSPLESSAEMHIFKTDLLGIPVNGSYFDVVTAWAVLEHVHDPREYFKKISLILKDNGIFVFFVPNFNSLAVRSLFHEDIPRHLYFFTPDNIRRYAREVGMQVEVEDHKNKYFVYNPNRWLFYFISRLTGKKINWPVNLSYTEFLESKKLRRNLLSLVAFFITNPASFVDSLLAPVIGRMERRKNTYAAVIYVARKFNNFRP